MQNDQEESKGAAASQGSSKGTPGHPGSQNNLTKGKQSIGSKRKFNEAKQKKSQDQMSAGNKRRKIDSSQQAKGSAGKAQVQQQQMQQVQNEQILATSQKTLDALASEEAKFFTKIGSRDFKTFHLEKCAKSQMFGNKLRSFANQQQSVAVGKQDPRLKLLVDQFKRYQADKAENASEGNLFKGKRVLDIGCHIGAIALQIGSYYDPAQVLGVDIDAMMVKAAIQNLHRMVNDVESKRQISLYQQDASNNEDQSMLTTIEIEKEKKIAKLMQRISSLPKSYQLNLTDESQYLQGQRSSMQAAVDVSRSQSVVNPEEIRAKVQFRSGNYIEEVSQDVVEREQFDIVLCLSTIKWIHLNFGDTGVKALFLKVYQQLTPGGFFIFDPQPWSSYKKMNKSRPVAMGEEQDIQLKPHLFKTYLKSIGLRLLLTVVDPAQPTTKPLYIYQK